MPSAGSITEDTDDAVCPVLGVDFLCTISYARARDARCGLYHALRSPNEWRKGRRWVLGLPFPMACGACAYGYTLCVGVGFVLEICGSAVRRLCEVAGSNMC